MNVYLVNITYYRSVFIVSNELLNYNFRMSFRKRFVCKRLKLITKIKYLDDTLLCSKRFLRIFCGTNSTFYQYSTTQWFLNTLKIPEISELT